MEVQSIPQDTATSAQSTSTPSTTASSTQLSILPSLSKQPRPAAAIPDNKQFERSDTPEGFFYNKRNSAKSEHQFIQPISKISKMESSVVDSKKPNEGMGLPGFSRSQVNLANSTPNLARVAKPLAPPPLNRGRSSFSKALFTFHGNSSATSLLSEDGTADSSPVILPSSLKMILIKISTIWCMGNPDWPRLVGSLDRVLNHNFFLKNILMLPRGRLFRLTMVMAP